MLSLQETKINQNSNTFPHVDLSFQVIGQSLPADHGYGLYSALSHWNQEIHSLQGLSIQTIAGIPDKQGKIYLTEKSRFRIRLRADQVPFVYGLAGQSLTIGSHHIRLGIPQIYQIKPAANLKARIVVIKGYQEPEDFLNAALKQLHELGVEASVVIPIDQEQRAERKTIKIKRFTVVGFKLGLFGLSDEDSIKLQIEGLGGKRRMGCGVFTPFNRTGA
jgi:CRISPR-associated protein Cas6